MTHPDFRALCSRLHELLEDIAKTHQGLDDGELGTLLHLREKTLAALSAPQQGAPSEDPPEKDAPSWYNSDMENAWEAGRVSGWTDAISRYDWWGMSRCDQLQQEQRRFREPERTILCDILANGTLLPDPQGTRYGAQAVPVAVAPPSGYAYRYPDYRGGTVIRFNSGCEVNDSKPIEAVPYWFTPQAAGAVAVAERLPGEVDCDEHGDCWWLESGMDAWYIDSYQDNWTHWLPHWALPLPEAQS